MTAHPFAVSAKEIKSMKTVEDYLYEIESEVSEADSACFDGCHKIYIMKDPLGTAQMREYEYEHIVPITKENQSEVVKTIIDWFNDSCGLKFINAVENDGRENEHYITVIGQFDLDEDEEDEDWDEEDEYDDEDESDE